jgi:hypothetical protein
MTKINILEIPVDNATARSLVQKELLRPRCVALNLHKKNEKNAQPILPYYPSSGIGYDRIQ